MEARSESTPLLDTPAMRERTGVFRDRAHAGEVLAALAAREPRDTLVLAIPAGGVPVAAALCRALDLPLDVAAVSKITLPWDSEAGYGAVAFDGTCRLNDEMVPDLGLSAEEIAEGERRARAKVARRVLFLRGGEAAPPIGGRAVLLVDDGLASGFTLAVAVEAVRRAGARRVAVAVPTAHRRAAERLAPAVDAFYCANLRGGLRFAVADAYRSWRDVSEGEALAELQGLQRVGC
jgi:predicted phosphoribosyltransferase